MFHAHAFAQRGMEEVDHIASCINIGQGCFKFVVHNDAVLELETNRLCQLDVRSDSDTSHDSICFDGAPAAVTDNEEYAVPLNAGNRLVRDDLDTLFAIIII